MSAEFTPGPWVASHADVSFSVVLANTLLAKVYSTAFRDTPQKVANANLMAAAPDLFESLQTVRRHLALFCNDSDEIAQAIFAQADAAIAKATGQSL